MKIVCLAIVNNIIILAKIQVSIQMETIQV